MNDEERTSTQDKAVNAEKKCKKAVKKQVQNQETYIPPTFIPEFDYQMIEPEEPVE